MTTLDDNKEQLRSNLELIGRESIDDMEAVLSVVGRYDEEGYHRVPDHCPAEFTWDYEKGAKPQLDKLYEKAKKAQWNAQTDLDWSIEVDQEKVVLANARGQPRPDAVGRRRPGRHRARAVGRQAASSGSASRTRTGCCPSSCTASRGRCSARPRSSRPCPWIDAKYYAATQVMDEARHVEVFSKYLDEKLSGHYPMNAHLGLLLDDIVADSRWDMTYLGMQIMVEGLALAAFGFIHMMTTEPLLKKLLRYVMADEARHVAFGVLSLQEYYKELSAAELRERQEFAFEAAIRMKDRMAMQEVWERMEVPTVRRPQDHVGGAGPGRLPDPAVLQDRAQPQEAGAPRRGRRLAADQVHRDGGDRLRAPERLHRGGGRVRRRIARRATGRLSATQYW